MSICFTGVHLVSGIQFPRKALIALANEAGVVTRKNPGFLTTYLVCGHKSSPEKVNVAKNYGIETITTYKFLQLMGYL